MKTRILLLFAALLVLRGVPVRAIKLPASVPVNLLSDPRPIPIGVWLQAPKNAGKYKALGINCYVGLWEGPTATQLADLEKIGMPLFCDQNAEGLKPRWQQEILGWLQSDEPDNARNSFPGGLWPTDFAGDNAGAVSGRKSADTRPVMLNLGQGVAWDNWYGRGTRTNKPEDYPQYVKAGDIVSFDIYPVVHESKEVAGGIVPLGGDSNGW